MSIVEPDDKKREETAQKFDVIEAFSSIDQTSLADFDLAVICTPANTHVNLMQACVSASLPFMVEKPLSVTEDGVSELLSQISATKLVARVGYIRRVADEVQVLRNQILQGKIGDLRLAYLNSSQEFPKYRPDYQSTYYARADMGGGAILDGASHLFDLLIWIVGRPVDVSCMYDRLVLKGTDTEDTCLINIRFENGAMANITINQFQKPNTSRIELIGTDGNLLLEHTRLSFSDSDDPNPVESKDYMEGLNPVEAHQARFTMQANAMLDAVEGKPCHLATLEEANVNLKLALAAKRSWTERKIITLDN